MSRTAGVRVVEYLKDKKVLPDYGFNYGSLETDLDRLLNYIDSNYAVALLSQRRRFEEKVNTLADKTYCQYCTFNSPVRDGGHILPDGIGYCPKTAIRNLLVSGEKNERA